MIFHHQVAEVTTALQRGKSVRLVGGRGSGKSTVLRGVAESLERTGVPVLLVRGEVVASNYPGYITERLSADLLGPTPRRSLAATVDALAAVLGETTVIVLDDIHLIDHSSLQVLSTIRDRLGLLSLMAMNSEPQRQLDFPVRWPERMICLKPMSMAQTAQLAHEVLCGRLDSVATARVYGKSGGVPLLATAVLDSARDRGLLAEREGMWSQTGPTLWNQDLVPLTVGYLDGVDEEIVTTLRDIALRQAVSLEQAQERYGTDILGRSADLGLLRLRPTTQGSFVSPWPPILVDCFRSGVHSMRASFDAHRKLSALPTHPDTSELAWLARTFDDHEQELSDQAFRAWLQSPNPLTAIAYFREASGDPRRKDEIERVMQQTDYQHRNASVADFTLVFEQAQWQIFEHGELEQGMKLLDSFGRDNHVWTDTCYAATTLLNMLMGRGVIDDSERLTAASADPTGLCRGVAALVLTARGQLAEAEALVTATDQQPVRGRVAEWCRLLLPLLRGDFEAGIALCEEHMREATLRLDRSSFVLASYGAIVGYHYRGDTQRMRNTLEKVLLVGCPELLFIPTFAAFLNLRGLIAHFDGQHTVREDNVYESALLHPQMGPFLGMGIDVVRAVIEGPASGAELDERMAATLRTRREAGYLLAAALTGFSCLVVNFGAATALEFCRAVSECDLPFFRQLGRLVELLASDDVEQIRAWVESIDAALPRTMTLRLIAAAARWDTAAGRITRATDLRAILDEHRDGPAETWTPPPTPSHPVTASLSPREREVGMLTGRLSNQQIAHRLHLSVRTVENHVANALKKTGAGTRQNLYQLLMDEKLPR
ncbi:hypothetical protein GCM10027417_22410 [Glutamicibacter endophyticus]